MDHLGICLADGKLAGGCAQVGDRGGGVGGDDGDDYGDGDYHDHGADDVDRQLCTG